MSATPVSPAVVADFTVGGNLTLNISAGNLVSAGSVTITAVNNNVDAPDKEVTLSGTASNTQGVTSPDDETLMDHR